MTSFRRDPLIDRQRFISRMGTSIGKTAMVRILRVRVHQQFFENSVSKNCGRCFAANTDPDGLIHPDYPNSDLNLPG